MLETILQVRDLTVHFKGSEAPALQAISFDLNRGEVLAVVGESGAGKTTLCRTLLRLQPASARVQGQVHLFGVNLLNAPEKTLQVIRGSQACLIPQAPELALNPVMCVRDHVEEIIRAHIPVPKRERRAKVETALAAAGLPAELGSAYPHQLSGGQRQRVLIAQTLACEPALLIADEPTSALDKALEGEIVILLQGLVQTRQLALILITHDPLLVRPLADRVLVIRQGCLVQSGRLQQLLNNPGSQYATRLIHSVVPLPPAELEPKAESEDVNHQPAALIEVTNLSKTYRRGKIRLSGDPIRALDGVSLRVPAGSVLALVGSSGAGKSTLARCLALLEEVDTGEICLGGGRVRYRSKKELRRFRSKVQLVWQHSAQPLNPRLPAVDLVAEPLRIANRASKSDSRECALDMMAELGLPPVLGHRTPLELSGGQRQRVALARALVLRPALLIFDEVFAGLDLPLAAEVTAMLLQLRASFSLTYIFITHDLRRAASLADEIAVMHNGQIVERGAPSTVFWRPKHEVTSRLVNAAAAMDGCKQEAGVSRT